MADVHFIPNFEFYFSIVNPLLLVKHMMTKSDFSLCGKGDIYYTRVILLSNKILHHNVKEVKEFWSILQT